MFKRLIKNQEVVPIQKKFSLNRKSFSSEHINLEKRNIGLNNIKKKLSFISLKSAQKKETNQNQNSNQEAKNERKKIIETNFISNKNLPKSKLNMPWERSTTRFNPLVLNDFTIDGHETNVTKRNLISNSLNSFLSNISQSDSISINQHFNKTSKKSNRFLTSTKLRYTVENHEDKFNKRENSRKKTPVERKSLIVSKSSSYSIEKQTLRQNLSNMIKSFKRSSKK